MGKPTKQVRRNKCAFKDCNNSLAKSPAIHLFRFPVNEERCKQWIIHSGRTDLLDLSPKSLNRKKVLCSIHFKDEDFLNQKTRNRLTRNAVPKKYDSEGVTPHLDSPELKLQEDMDNYIKFKLMGGPKRMKPTVVPHIFDCQQERERYLTLPLSSAAVASTSTLSCESENVAETEAQVGIASTSKESQLFAFEFIDPSEIRAGQNSGSTSSVEPKKIKLEKDEPEYVDPQQLSNNPENSSEMLRLEEIKSEIELEYNEISEPEFVDPQQFNNYNPENTSEVLRLEEIKSEIKLEYNELSEPEYVDPQQLNYNPEKSSEILRLEEIKSEIKLEYNELSADLDNCEFAADIKEESRDFSVAITEEVCDIEKLDYN